MGLSSRDYYRPSGLGGFTFFPPVIKNLLIINIGVFFIQMIFDSISFDGVPGWYYLYRYFALNPISGIDRLTGGDFNFQIWQIITYQFMHADFTHILFNMFMLWMFGMEIESIMGSKKFLFYYLLSGVGAGLFQLLIPPIIGDAAGYTIGASGAVYGIMVAFAMFFPDRYIFIWFLIPIKAKYLIVILMVFEFMSVTDPSVVAHLAHIGGALTGLVFLLLDKQFNFNFNSAIKKFKKPGSFNSSTRFRKTADSDTEIEDAKYYDINDNSKKESNVTQEEIDRILDKISQSGYQNLTDREKKILFEASKK